MEQVILELNGKVNDDVYFMLIGDFNARTGNQNSTCSTEEWAVFSSNECYLTRSSQDNVENANGNQLLDLCSMIDCSILNGVIEFQFDDAMTFISTNGKSVIDYFVLSNDLCKAKFLQSLKVLERIESSHLPVALEILTTVAEPLNTCQTERTLEKFIWDKDKEHVYISELQSRETRNKLAHAKHEIGNDVNTALDLFVDCVTSASRCMKKTINIVPGKKKMKSWFDGECHTARRTTKSKLRKFKRTKTDNDRICYVNARREYHTLIKKKKQAYKQNKVDYLSNIVKQPGAFWQELRSCTGMRQKQITSNSIN